jgi:hypothetical protein
MAAFAHAGAGGFGRRGGRQAIAESMGPAGSFCHEWRTVPDARNTTTTTTTPNGVTPNNTYTFTVVGVDADGVISSNTTSTTSANPTVTLTVTSPKN